MRVGVRCFFFLEEQSFLFEERRDLLVRFARTPLRLYGQARKIFYRKHEFSLLGYMPYKRNLLPLPECKVIRAECRSDVHDARTLAERHKVGAIHAPYFIIFGEFACEIVERRQIFFADKLFTFIFRNN